MMLVFNKRKELHIVLENHFSKLIKSLKIKQLLIAINCNESNNRQSMFYEFNYKHNIIQLYTN